MGAAGFEVVESSFDFLADVDAIHQVVPRGLGGQVTNELERFGFEVGAFGSGGGLGYVGGQLF